MVALGSAKVHRPALHLKFFWWRTPPAEDLSAASRKFTTQADADRNARQGAISVG